MNVGNLLAFMFFVFGIFGLQLFMGKLRFKCFEKPEGIDWNANPDTEWLRVHADDWAICGTAPGAWSQCDAGQICSDKVVSGEAGTTLGLWNEDPGEGNIGFDNIFQSFLTILTAMSLEGWIDMCFAAWDAVGFIAVPYFILIVVFGSLFAINLVVAVIYEAYVANAKDLTKPPADMPQEIIEIEAAERFAIEEKKRIKAEKLAMLEFPDRWRVDKQVVFDNTFFLYKWYAEFRDACYTFGTNENFGTIVTLAILVNTLFMSMEFHGASESHRKMLEEANWFFTILFTFELVVKSIGMGVCNYLADPYNSFDASVVTFSWVEVALLSGGGFSSLRTFRLLRVLRTLKLAKSWHSLNQLIITVIRSIPGLANFGLILMLFLFIYALFGMQFYGGKFNEENGFDGTPRANFNTLGFALLTVFQVVTGENWNDVLYNVMKVNGAVGAIYASSMFCIGNYIVLNLFLAILLDNFQQAGGESKSTFYEEIERENDVKAALSKVKILVKNLYRLACPSCFVFKICILTEEEEAKESKNKDKLMKDKADKKAALNAARAAAVHDEKIAPAAEQPTKSKAAANKTSKRMTFSEQEGGGYFFGGGGGGGGNTTGDVSGGGGGSSAVQSQEENPYISTKTAHSVEKDRRKAETQEVEDMGYYFGNPLDEDKVVEEYKKPPPQSTFFKRMSLALGIQQPDSPKPSQQSVQMTNLQQVNEDEEMEDGGDIATPFSQQRNIPTKPKSARHQHPVATKVVRGKDRLYDFVLDATDISLQRIHANVIHLYQANSEDATGYFANQSVEEASMITKSIRQSVSSLAISKEMLDDMSVGSFSVPDGDKGTIKIKTKKGVNLESARHESMMDEELKEDFKIVRNFMKLIRRGINIKTRHRGARTYMDSFSGAEFIEFLKKNKVTKRNNDAAIVGQRLLELGFFNLAIAPKKKKRGHDGSGIQEVKPAAHSRERAKSKAEREAMVKNAKGEQIRVARHSIVEIDHKEMKDMRGRGASVLAMEWEADSMIFFADLDRLYTIGDITPSAISLMEPTAVQKVRGAKKVAMEREVKYELCLSNKTSLCVLHRDNGFRKACAKKVVDPLFDNIILFLIAYSSVLLALDEPAVAEAPDSFLAQFLHVNDYALTALFVGEMMLKIFAMGFFMGPTAYLKNSWNILDFVIVMVSVAGIVLVGKVDLTFLKSLRAMRGLRPLRMISRAPNMKVVVNAIFIALPACINVILVVLMCFLIFSICGSTFFSGLLYYCNGDGDTDRYSLDLDQCVGNWTNITVTDGDGNTYLQGVPREWINQPYHFDSVPRAMTTLFEIASLEMWPDIMASCNDVTQVDKHPEIDASVGYAFFFVFFIFLGSFFVINLFVGVVINKFGEVKAEGGNVSLFLSDDQMEWVRAQKSIMASRAPMRFKSPWERARFVGTTCGYASVLDKREKIYALVESDKFDNFIMTVIMMSIFSMAMPYHNMSDGYVLALDSVDYVWNAIFIMEMILKFFGLGFRQYFSAGWNRFDFFIVVCSIMDMIASSMGISIGIDIKILRVLRIARMVRLIKHNKPLLNLFVALFTSLPSLANVGSILMLCLYVFAVMGMNLFADVTPANYDDLEFITDRNNFSTFAYSMLTLFRTATGESWNGLMHDLEAKGHAVALPYFMSFVVIGTFIMLNLFIAVILENFAEAQNEDDFHLNNDHIEQFGKLWRELDTEKDYFMEGYKLVDLLYRLDPPLGLKGQEHLVTRWEEDLYKPDVMQVNRHGHKVRRKHIIQYVRELGIKRDKYGMVFFLDVLSAFARKGFGLDGAMDMSELDQKTFDSINGELMESLSGELRIKMNIMDKTSVLCDLSDEFNSACMLQCMYRGRMARRIFYENTKAKGLWTKRLDQMYKVTLNLWRDRSQIDQSLASNKKANAYRKYVEDTTNARHSEEEQIKEQVKQMSRQAEPLSKERELDEMMEEAEKVVVENVVQEKKRISMFGFNKQPAERKWGQRPQGPTSMHGGNGAPAPAPAPRELQRSPSWAAKGGGELGAGSPRMSNFGAKGGAIVRAAEQSAVLLGAAPISSRPVVRPGLEKAQSQHELHPSYDKL
ncbi:hypothetical protein TrLO_g993 [Triparma laevis f. longispina]|uniref:DEP domain-containing protein n=1 Tax=Triparma laevis f. longispina TaxID=1714387 RepID=A0A9W7DPW4_9STRA|nr:hypothetical protein TrLO_g993 [Triparma laevis f. longispina]